MVPRKTSTEITTPWAIWTVLSRFWGFGIAEALFVEDVARLDTPVAK